MATNLVTRNECKNYLGITSINKDGEIDNLIPQVSSLVKTYCRRTFIDYYDEMQTEYFDGGYDRFILKEGPVKQVLSVRKSANYGQTWTTLTEYTDWVTQGDTVVPIGVKEWPVILNGYKVEYFGGFEVLPPEIKLATLDIISYYLKHNSAVHVNREVNSPSVTQINYISSTHFPAHIKRVLDQYVADYA